MNDLISRQDAINAMYRLEMEDVETYGCSIPEGFDAKSAVEALEALPSAEPEQKKGEWIKVGHWGRSYKCNQCGNYLDFDGVNAGRGDANFCPNCGAKME